MSETPYYLRVMHYEAHRLFRRSTSGQELTIFSPWSKRLLFHFFKPAQLTCLIHSRGIIRQTDETYRGGERLHGLQLHVPTTDVEHTYADSLGPAFTWLLKLSSF